MSVAQQRAGPCRVTGSERAGLEYDVNDASCDVHGERGDVPARIDDRSSDEERGGSKCRVTIGDRMRGQGRSLANHGIVRDAGVEGEHHVIGQAGVRADSGVRRDYAAGTEVRAGSHVRQWVNDRGEPGATLAEGTGDTKPQTRVTDCQHQLIVRMGPVRVDRTEYLLFQRSWFDFRGAIVKETANRILPVDVLEVLEHLAAETASSDDDVRLHAKVTGSACR